MTEEASETRYWALVAVDFTCKQDQDPVEVARGLVETLRTILPDPAVDIVLDDVMEGTLRI